MNLKRPLYKGVFYNSYLIGMAYEYNKSGSYRYYCVLFTIKLRVILDQQNRFSIDKNNVLSKFLNSSYVHDKIEKNSGSLFGEWFCFWYGEKSS